MIYRRYPGIRRRYINPGMFTYQNDSENENLLTKGVEPEASIKDIPLPNQVEKKEAAPPVHRNTKTKTFIDMIKGRLHVEDLLLIALIFLLLDEGVEDDFLLLMLLFVFLS